MQNKFKISKLFLSDRERNLTRILIYYTSAINWDSLVCVVHVKKKMCVNCKS